MEVEPQKIKIDYNASCERINTALTTLRKELTLLREQDVRLLKQLINIHETIRKLSKAKNLDSRSYSCSSRALNLSSNGFTPSSKRPPLVRQQSEPHFCVDSGFYRGLSTSSTEDYLDFPDDGLSSGSEFDESTSSLRSLKHYERLRTRSVSLIATVPIDCSELAGGNASYDQILQRNIRLWKWSQSQDRDSVFEEETFVISESDAER
ncbi:hypothetical protein SNE40_018722 [Patella caerulea]|uniref:Uncharacterized protein n=1 Tax=Patella caerulea TaxID=87958 RepID=A0AAN8J6X9_PATCE